MFSVRAAAVVIASFLVLSQGVLGALTQTQAITNNQVLSSQYNTINTALLGIETSSSGATVISTGQEVVNQFNAVILNLQRDVVAMRGTPPFTDTEAAPVVSSLADYLAIHRVVMVTLIGKHSIFAQFAVTAPIAAVLRTLEASIDSYLIAMHELIPTRTADLARDQNVFDTTTSGTVNTYDQVCVPSPLYPVVMPPCAA